MAVITQTQPASKSIVLTMPLRYVLGFALATLSGALLWLAFPPVNLWYLSWIGFVPGLYAQHRLVQKRHSHIARAVIAGVWLWPMLARIFAGGPWWLVHLGLIIFIISLLTEKDRHFHEKTGYRWFVLLGILAAVGFEMARSFIPFLGTMGFMANTQATQAWLLQPISIFSIYGMSLMIMLSNFALTYALIAWLDRRWLPEDAVPVDPRHAYRWLAGAALVVFAWVGLSLGIFWTSPKDSPSVRVAALQPGYPAPAHVDSSIPQSQRVQTIIELGLKAGELGPELGPQLFITPELGMAVDPQVEFTQDFKRLTARTGAYAFLTYGLDKDDGFHNESVLLTPQGQFLDVYGKIHPGPGEPKAAYSDHYPVYDTPFGRIATIICMDGNTTDVTRRLAQLGAQLIAVPTRETLGISEHQWSHHVMRAVETRTAVIKNDVAWGSMIIDPYGRILYKEMNSQPTKLVLSGSVPLGSGKTLVNKVGDWLGWVLLAGWIFMMVSQPRLERQFAKRSQIVDK